MVFKDSIGNPLVNDMRIGKVLLQSSQVVNGLQR